MHDHTIPIKTFPLSLSIANSLALDDLRHIFCANWAYETNSGQSADDQNNLDVAFKAFVVVPKGLEEPQ